MEEASPDGAGPGAVVVPSLEVMDLDNLNFEGQAGWEDNKGTRLRGPKVGFVLLGTRWLPANLPSPILANVPSGRIPDESKWKNT
jgi:hypothetical protein